MKSRIQTLQNPKYVSFILTDSRATASEVDCLIPSLSQKAPFELDQSDNVVSLLDTGGRHHLLMRLWAWLPLTTTSVLKANDFLCVGQRWLFSALQA